MHVPCAWCLSVLVYCILRETLLSHTRENGPHRGEVEVIDLQIRLPSFIDFKQPTTVSCLIFYAALRKKNHPVWGV